MKNTNKPLLDVDKGDVGLQGYNDKISKPKNVYEQEYSLLWLEVETK